jgi:hypothetical protein
MVKLKINVNNDLLLRLQHELAKLDARTMSSTARAMKSSADLVQNVWRNFAGGGSLPGIESLKSPSRGYAMSIKVQQNGPFDYEVYSEAKIARQIEEGTRELDMKTAHPYGPRSRVSKKGVPYLIIPFRWGTPGTVGFRNIMPEAVYSIMRYKKLFDRSTVRNTTHTEKNFSGEDVERREYNWGDRSKNSFAEYLTGQSVDDPNTEGMVAMDTGSSKKQYTGYFTFRVISADSPASSWIRPAMRARPVTQAVARVTEDAISEIVGGAITEDLGL